jgi:hypothetical protein
MNPLIPFGLSAALAAPTLPANYADNLKQAPGDQICRGARSLSRAQGDFRGSGGLTRATWEWPNAGGIIATALIRSIGSASGCNSHEAIARFADARVAEHTRGEFLYDPDIEALAAATEVLKSPAYARVAREAFEKRYEGATGREIFERWFAIHRDPTIIGYDVALAVRAGIAAGDLSKAREIADAAVSAVPRWGEGIDHNGWLATSRGALLDALTRLDPDRYLLARRDLTHHLMLTQGSDGSWSGRNTQATAYAVLGLSMSGDPYATAAADRGRTWLRLTQLSGGSWAMFNDLLPEPFVGEIFSEVTAEAILAVASR